MLLRKTIERPLYTDRLEDPAIAPGTVKVLLGIRGCGKTTALNQYVADLEQKGVPSDHIIFLDLDKVFFDRAGTGADLVTYVHNRLPAGSGRVYLVLDAVVHPDAWAEACDTLTAERDIDITAAVCSGRAVAPGRRMPKRFILIQVRPLLFSKYLELFPLHDGLTVRDRFRQYMVYGGLPSIDADWPDAAKRAKLTEIVNEVNVRDIASVYEEVDFRHIDAVLSSLFRNSGSFLDAASVSKGTGMPVREVYRCLQIIEHEHLVIPLRAFDLKDRKPRPELGMKFYSVDIGLLNAAEGRFPDPPDRYRYENAV